MPLIVITGYPSSGKSTRAKQLKEFMETKHGKKVTVLSENEVITSSNFNKNNVYLDSSKEKEIRGILKTMSQRSVDTENVVIIDAGNYIKGYRYELYCMSKSCKTTQCTIQCEISPTLAWEWNTSRQICNGSGDESYSKEVFDALVMRFEAPDNRNRWDSPLILLQADDALPGEDIYNAIFQRKPPPPNQSTQNVILSAQKLGVQGNVKLTGYQGLSVDLGNSTLTPAQLGRIRRQFLTYCKMHASGDTTKVAPLFVQYLTTAFKE